MVMRPVSKKRSAYAKSIKPMLDEFRAEFPTCMVCGGTWALAVHEIARGAHRKQARGDRRALLRVCGQCHEEMDDYSQWPIARQAAVKLVADPKWFCLETLCELRGRAKTDLTIVEVAEWLQIQS